jgi:hypothetical protein
MRSFIAIALSILFFSCQEEETPVTSLANVAIEIVTPEPNESFSPGDSVWFKAEIHSQKDIRNLKYAWLSDKDGLLQEGKLGKANEVEFKTKGLSKNIHHITFQVTNEVDSMLEQKVILYNLLNLRVKEKHDNSTTFIWTAVPENFKSYSIYRHYYTYVPNGGTLIGEITEVSDTLFTDTTATLGVPYYYQVAANLITEGMAVSNVVNSTAGIALTLKFPISKIISIPNHSYVYGIVPRGDPYFTNPDGYGIVVIDPSEFKIIDRILMWNRFSDITVDPAGEFLYACQDYTVYKINLLDRTIAKTITLPKRAHAIEVGTNNRLYYHETPPTSGSTQFGIYDLVNDRNLINSWYVQHGDFELDMSTNNIIHGESNSTGSCLRKFSTSDDIIKLLIEAGCRDDGSSLLIFNQATRKIYWRYWVFDEQLIKIGTFQVSGSEQGVFDISNDGSTAVTWGHLFNTKDLTVRKKVPANYDKAFFINDNQMILVRNTSPEYQKYVTHLHRYTFRD